MQRLEVSGAVGPIYGSLGVKWLRKGSKVMAMLEGANRWMNLQPIGLNFEPRGELLWNCMGAAFLGAWRWNFPFPSHGASPPTRPEPRYYHEASRSYSDTPHSAGLLWTSDKPDDLPTHNTQNRQTTMPLKVLKPIIPASSHRPTP